VARGVLIRLAMRSLLVATVAVAATATAVADPSEIIHAEPAKPGLLAGTPVATKAFGHGRIDVLDLAQPAFDEHDLRVVVSDGTRWWGATDDVAIYDVDCATGKCMHDALDRVTVEVAGDIAWVRFERTTEVRHNDPDLRDLDRDTHTTAVIGCSLPHDGEPPHCAKLDPSVLASSTVTIHGTTLTVRDEAPRTVEIAF